MPSNSLDSVLNSALALPPTDRIAVIGALHSSLADPALDHAVESDSNVDAEWKHEIERRLADIDQGLVKTIPADEADRMIRGESLPDV